MTVNSQPIPHHSPFCYTACTTVSTIMFGVGTAIFDSGIRQQCSLKGTALLCALNVSGFVIWFLGAAVGVASLRLRG